MPEPGNMAAAPASPAASAPAPGKLRRWLWAIRANSRLAFLLQLATRVLTSGLNLFWIRLLVGAMGKPLNGLYLAFQSVFSLGGLGDLGMGGAVGIRAGQYLGKEKENDPELQRFLASARAVFLFLTIAVVGLMLLFAHWIPHWLNFPSVPEAGSLTKVFAVGAAIVGGVLLFSYISNVNYACGNVGWPVLPDFLLLQASLLCHWLLARQGQPLWMQYLPYLVSAGIKLLLMWIYVRASHPSLSRLLPLRI
ncbi:MAG TPA: hypothetical protein VFB72_05790, partial [Verrucomicrobiae bacterium]|nr:hypothetical protein [Verrucomicrobiae bacterium]